MGESKEKVIITAALLYANGVVHFGHIAGAYLPADCAARLERLQGNDVLFLSGSDEYGVAITLSAELAGRTPQAHVDHFDQVNRRVLKQLNIAFDHFARTTWEGHPQLVQKFFYDLLAKGHIEKKETEQLYSEGEGRFLADRYVIGTCPKCHFEEARGDECPSCGASYEATNLGNPRSRLTDHPLTLKKTTHWFLCLDQFIQELQAWMGEKAWRPMIRHFVSSTLEELHPRAITRDGDWGIPVPLKEGEGKVFYVWFEACIGYLSAAREWALNQKKPNAWKEYWCDPNTRLIQFIGKDNIFFHAIFFPAMIMGQSQPYKLVDELPANEFLHLEGKQFSKTDRWTIDLEDFLTRYSADQIRYALAANAPETGDAEFTWHDFEMRCNRELLGKYGNLARRVLVFVNRQCNGKIPNIPLPPDAQSPAFLNQLTNLAEEARTHYRHHSLRKVCHTIMEIAHLGNTFFDKEQPWVAAKENRPQMEITLRLCLECLKTLAVVSAPLIPETSEKLWYQLGQTAPLTDWDNALHPLSPGQILPPSEILFEKIAPEQIEDEIARLRGP